MMGTLIKKSKADMRTQTQAQLEAAVRLLLSCIDDDPDRDGLQDTPKRVVKSFNELYGGHDVDPKAHLERVFAVEHDQLIALNGIEFYSTCEHHMLPFFGTVDVAYLPSKDGGIVGISKLARVVHGYARRLQVQERLTDQIADAIETALEPRAVGVRVRGAHMYMVARGVATPLSCGMTTTAVRGMIKEDAALRAEWMSGLPE